MDLKSIIRLLPYYLIIINVFSFLLYILDKYLAIKNKWRVRESHLILTAALGGAFGAYAAMLLVRHKTQHLKFNILVPILAVIWGYLIFRYYILFFS